ncbi:antirestriction protein [Bifidobacterium saguini DSM 23967]|uniref:Antirestriction protein n=2 Tax=Bifidobacterium saguini TaxID=762210 RepID=A0A087D5P1_9BIFI|nr:antirestriction protein ArdA [Bifidobacterium saguini]KFI90841.1 antirestriction protein [Bifidobacterium saguini DSM 23967]QTB90744.1 antirestriction protein ArdA [Bifidobacterium saguini]
MSNRLEDHQMRVYVANLGKYNEGVLQGAWITLPMRDGELADVLKNKVGLTGRYEEYAIHDYEGGEGLLSYMPAPGEYTPLDDLNLMCKVFESRELDDPDVYEKVKNYIDGIGGVQYPIEIMNLAMESDDIDYHAYDTGYGPDNPKFFKSNEEKFGYSIIEAHSVMRDDRSVMVVDPMEDEDLAAVAAIENSNYSSFFDKARFGEEYKLETDATLTDDGYLFSGSIDTDRWSRDELKEEVEWMDRPRDSETCNPADPLNLAAGSAPSITR